MSTEVEIARSRRSIELYRSKSLRPSKGLSGSIKCIFQPWSHYISNTRHHYDIEDIKCKYFITCVGYRAYRLHFHMQFHIGHMTSPFWRKGVPQFSREPCYTYKSMLSGAHADIGIRPYAGGATMIGCRFRSKREASVRKCQTRKKCHQFICVTYWHVGKIKKNASGDYWQCVKDIQIEMRVVPMKIFFTTQSTSSDRERSLHTKNETVDVRTSHNHYFMSRVLRVFFITLRVIRKLTCNLAESLHESILKPNLGIF